MAKEMPSANLEIRPEVIKGLKKVEKNLKDLGLDQEIIFTDKNFLPIKYKLAEMACNQEVSDADQFKKTHFNESVQIAKHVKSFFEDILEKMDDENSSKIIEKLGITKDKKTLVLAALLHDIGKTGLELDSYMKQNNVIIQLYNYKYGERLDSKRKIWDILNEMRGREWSMTDEDIEQLKLVGLSGDNTMRDLYDIHSKITEEIFKSLFNTEFLHDISLATDQANLPVVAARHHYMNNFEYGGEVYGDSLLIEFFDKYVAFVMRSKDSDIHNIYNNISGLIKDIKDQKIKQKFEVLLDFFKSRLDSKK